MSDSRFAHRLTEQIGNEFAASQQYIAIAVPITTPTRSRSSPGSSTGSPSKSATTR